MTFAVPAVWRVMTGREIADRPASRAETTDPRPDEVILTFSDRDA
jgi:hypothetical protein